jgi:methylglutaconyl-CoA hydratase
MRMPAPTASSDLLVTIEGAVARIVMNRAERHNAFDDALIAQLISALAALAQNGQVRIVQLAGAGKSFSAGADLTWMKRMAAYGRAQNLADAGELGRLMRLLHDLPKPTVALVQGAVYGGGVGLAAACDFVIAAPDAVFSLSEVKLGLIPAVISPYVVQAVGARAANRLFLTAERFDAGEAHRLGLVTQIAADGQLQAAADRLSRELLANSPAAMTAAKALVRRVAGRPIDDELVAATVEGIADQRASPEGREGVAAFLEKRPANWRLP